MTPWIQNVSMAAIASGDHYDAGLNSVLIQIVDPCYTFPVPKYRFSEVYRFEFLDIEEDARICAEFKIDADQAAELVNILRHALEGNLNVVVHCHAGKCRSGAVAEVGVMMGFRDTETHRQPNVLVKTSMLRALGWGYYSDQPDDIPGSDYDSYGNRKIWIPNR